MDIKEVQYLTSTSLSRDSGWGGQCAPGIWRERLFGGISQINLVSVLGIFWYLCNCLIFGNLCMTQSTNNSKVWRGHFYFRDKQRCKVKKSRPSSHLGHHLLQPSCSHCAGHRGGIYKIQLFTKNLEIHNFVFSIHWL